MWKRCYACQEWKTISEFYRDSSRKDGLNARCRLCTNSANKKYEQANKNKIRARKQQYYRTKKDEILAQHRNYNRRNKKKNNARLRRRRREDPAFRLRETVSRTIGRMLRSQGKTKTASVLQHLPYTMDELKSHLECQFESWMSWANYGRYYRNGERRWHIDHVIPQSELPYDSMEHDNFLKCWSLNNLRPMEAVANIKKSNR